ncbi:hypothetical protein ACFO3I_14135 [Rheinheimera marina]|uniref:Pectin esterase n=1 Tax=Rheinheimera marina TaxID=1774958 RepID=A0ABV9JPL8_9GAMM
MTGWWLRLCCGLVLALSAQAQAAQLPAPPLPSAPIVLQVAADGSAPFRSIQSAIDSLPQDNGMPEQRWALIRIAPGLYREKLYLQRDKVVLAGHSLTDTVIQYPELRQHFLARQGETALPTGQGLSRDWGAAVVNIASSDIALLDLTVHNSYALDHPQDPLRFEHQFALRGFEQASRILTDRVMLSSAGADTVSLWNKQNGMYYHSRSYFSGRVDLFCPRGTAYVTNSDFVNYNNQATLWHDGELAETQKLVVTHSRFHGVSGYQLGRRHYDGQFVLLHNKFSSALANQPLFRRTYPAQPERDQPNRYGDRNYFYHNQGPAYDWLQDNLTAQQAETYTTAQVFNGLWQPEQQLQLFRSWLKDK